MTVKANISESSFLQNHKSAFINCRNISGSNVSANRKTSLLAAFGEFFEREALYYYSSRIRNKGVKGYSIVQERTITIDADAIVECYLFYDSCGLATYTHSKGCLSNALDEFIERQSFVFNYLSKGKGQIVSGNYLNKIINRNSLYRNITFYDISLIPDFYVILGKGLVDTNFYVGLGASSNFCVALQRCIKEIDQEFRAYELGHLLDKREKDYWEHFRNLSSEKLVKAYSYLDESGNYLNVTDSPGKIPTIKELVMLLNKQCGMDPLITFLEPRCSLNYKIAWVFDFNWFPGLLPKCYPERTYKYIEKRMETTLDRACTFIPFP